MVNASGFQQREESGSRSVHQFSAQARMSLRTGRGADIKLILQGLEVERSFTRLNICLGFFKPPSLILLNCFHSSIHGCIDDFREKQGKTLKIHHVSMKSELKTHVQAAGFEQRWQLQIWDIQVRSTVKQSSLDNQQRARDTFVLSLVPRDPEHCLKKPFSSHWPQN